VRLLFFLHFDAGAYLSAGWRPGTGLATLEFDVYLKDAKRKNVIGDW
jgi:hypothetical protein